MADELAIVKVTDKKAASVRPLDEVRPQIVDQLKWERAQNQLTDVAALLQAEIKKPGDLDKAAAKQGTKVQESGFFQRDEPITGIGPAPEPAAEAFTLKEGEVSGAIRIPQGIAFLAVTGKQDARPAKRDEVKDKVREAVIRQKALEAARARAGGAARGRRCRNPAGRSRTNNEILDAMSQITREKSVDRALLIETLEAGKKWGHGN